MKNLTRWLVLCVVTMVLLVGCASEPTKEIEEAKAVIDAATTEGANIYAADGLSALNVEFQAAVDMAKANTGKLFKSNKEAIEKLAKVKADAEALKATIPAKKEEAKNAALAAQTETKAAVDEAKALVETAPKGKDSQAEIEAFKADLTALDEPLAEVQKLIDSEDFFGAADKCKTIKEKAVSVSDQIKAAIEKIQAAQPKKKGKK